MLWCMYFNMFALCYVIQFDHLQKILTSGVSAVAALAKEGFITFRAEVVRTKQFLMVSVE